MPEQLRGMARVEWERAPDGDWRRAPVVYDCVPELFPTAWEEDFKRCALAEVINPEVSNA